MKKAYFDEANVLETYQPRARTMGHLFCPEPPTPAPKVQFSLDTEEKKHTASETAAFNAIRDSHYANMYEYAMKMQKEMKAMEEANASLASQPSEMATASSSVAPTQDSSTSGGESVGSDANASSKKEKNKNKKRSKPRNEDSIH